MAECPGYGGCHADKQSPSPACRREIGCHHINPVGSVHALHGFADRIDDCVMTLFGMKADVIAGE
jgi:hypothetical protein